MTTGASNDLQQVANVARQMITKFGMSDKIGPVALGQSQGGMSVSYTHLTLPTIA